MQYNTKPLIVGGEQGMWSLIHALRGRKSEGCIRANAEIPVVLLCAQCFRLIARWSCVCAQCRAHFTDACRACAHLVVFTARKISVCQLGRQTHGCRHVTKRRCTPKRTRWTRAALRFRVRSAIGLPMATTRGVLVGRPW